MKNWEAIADEIKSHVAAMSDEDAAAAVDLCESINTLFAHTKTANINRVAAILLIARVCSENMAEGMQVNVGLAAHALGHFLHDSLTVAQGCDLAQRSVH